MELTRYMGYLGQKLKECVTLRPGSDAVTSGLTHLACFTSVNVNY